MQYSLYSQRHRDFARPRICTAPETSAALGRSAAAATPAERCCSETLETGLTLEEGVLWRNIGSSDFHLPVGTTDLWMRRLALSNEQGVGVGLAVVAWRRHEVAEPQPRDRSDGRWRPLVWAGARCNRDVGHVHRDVEDGLRGAAIDNSTASPKEEVEGLGG
jgi:hypothetical protein